MNNQTWFVYIIENEKGLLYTGITTDIERRFNEHLRSKKGAKFFRSGAPKKILYKIICQSRSEATKIEISIKKMTRAKKLELIKKQARGI